MNLLNAKGIRQRPRCEICSVYSLNDLLWSISCHSVRTRSSVQHSSAALTRHRDERGVTLLSRMHETRVGRRTRHAIGMSRVGRDPMIAVRAVKEVRT